jgi:hypothetical protein
VSEIDDLSHGELIALVRRLFVEVQDLTRVNAELVAANTALTERVTRLERLVTRNSRDFADAAVEGRRSGPRTAG